MNPNWFFFLSLDILFTDSIYHQPSIVTSNVNKFYGLQKDKNGKSTITTYDIGGGSRKSHRIYSTNRELSKFWVSGLEDGVGDIVVMWCGFYCLFFFLSIRLHARLPISHTISSVFFSLKSSMFAAAASAVVVCNQ